MPQPVSARNATSFTNVRGGDHYDPAGWLIAPAKTFHDLKVGDVFRAPSRPFATVSGTKTLNILSNMQASIRP